MAAEADETLRKAAAALNIGGAQSRARLRAAVAQYPVLLTAAGDAFLTELADRLPVGDRFVLVRWYLRDLMRRCAQEGAEQVLLPLSQASSPLRLNWFLRVAESGYMARRALKKAPHLMREQSVAELERMIGIAARMDDPRAVGWRHLPWLLRACREHGLDAALPRKVFDPVAGARRRREINALLRQSQQVFAAFLTAGTPEVVSDRFLRLISDPEHTPGTLEPLGAVSDKFLALISGPGFQREDARVQAGIMGLVALQISTLGVGDKASHADSLRIAASLGDRAARLADPGSQVLAFVTSNRAETLAELATRTLHPADIEAAVEAATAAVEAARAYPWIAQHPQMALAGALYTRFAVAESAADLKAAAHHSRETIVMTPPWAPEWPAMVAMMGPALVQHALVSEDPGEWKEVIRELRAADRALAPESPARPRLQVLLDATAAVAEEPADP